MIDLSADERRIASWLLTLAKRYDAAADRNPFGFHRVRAKLCRKIAAAIESGAHR